MKVLEKKPIVDMNAKVIKVIEETPTVKTLVFDIKDYEFDFYPGQYIMIEVPYNGQILKRAYSIASSPLQKDKLEITVKRMKNGRASVVLTTKVKEGDVFHIKGPYGKFIWTEDMSDRVILIGAGSGVVPLMCILRYIRDKDLKDVQATLLVSYKTYDEIIYRKELEELNKLDNIKVVITLTRENPEFWKGYTGRINKDMILKEVGDLSSGLFYLCGPPKFVDDMKETLLNLGVEKERIRTEKYD